MRLLKAEIQKITGVKWFAAVLAALIFASSLVCFFYVSGGERSSYTPEQVETIKEFAAEFSVDPDGLAVFKQSCANARRAIMLRLGEEYEKELEAGADERELEKRYEAIYTDPSTFLTYVFSDKIDDASLITAYERLNAVKSDFDFGVNLILRQSERNAAELRTEYGMTPDDPLYQYQIYGGKSRENHFVNIMACTKNGRSDTFIAKARFAVVSSAVLALVFCAAEASILMPGRSLDYMSVPLYSISAYAETGIGMPVGVYLLIVLFIRIASAALLALLSLSVSALVKNFTAAFSIAAGMTLLPAFLFRAGLDFAGYASFVDFLSGNGMVLFSAGKRLCQSSFGALLTYFIIISILSLAVTAAAYFRNGERRRI